MKEVLFTLLAVAICSMGFGQAFNDVMAEKRDLKDFHSVRVSHTFDVYLIQSGEETVAVSAVDKDFISQIRTEVKNGELHIWHDGGSIRHLNLAKLKLKVYISFKELDKVDLSRNCHLYAVGEWKDERLKREVLESADNGK